MKIGIDLDGVIFDTERQFRYYGEMYNIEHHDGFVADRTDRSLKSRFGWTDEEMHNFYLNYMLDCERNAPFIVGAVDIMKKLKEMGHALCIISRRGLDGDDDINVALQRLKKEGLEFEEVYFGAEDKASICVEHNVAIMIDDSSYNVLPICEAGIKCLYMHDELDIHVRHPKAKAVDNWAHIYNYFLNLDKKI